MNKYLSELLGTMILVLIGCGAAIQLDVIGTTGVALAFGLSIVAVAYSFGNISGAHLNPAVTIGFIANDRMEVREGLMYMLFQTIGAIIGSIVLAILFGADSGLGINMIQSGHTLLQGAIFELTFTFLFVLVILAVTAKEEFQKLAGLVIGLTLTAVHLVGIGITGTSVNPARSIAPALVTMDSTALSQLWIFIVFPLIGGILAALIWNVLKNKLK